jgi:hypothetical protein
MEKLDIKFMPKDSNPPNCPQMRPIETYWALLRRRVYNNGWKAKSVKELKEKIRKEMRFTS